MIIINYGTNEYYEARLGNKYYCKTINSAKKKLKELLREEGYKNDQIKDTLKPLEEYIFNKKTCFSAGSIPNLEDDYIYIGLKEEDLF